MGIVHPRNSYGKEGFSQEEFANYQLKMGYRQEMPEVDPYYWDGPDAEKIRLPFSQIETVNGKQQAVLASQKLRDMERQPPKKNH